jgi:hypothetical protein
MFRAGLERKREAGSAMVVVMVLMVFLLALGGAMTMTSTVGLRANRESDREMRAFYLADSGAQMGIAKVRASGATMDDSSFIDNIAGGSVSVAITRESPVLYRIWSNAAYEGASRSVEVHLRFEGGFNLPGGYTIMFSRGVSIRSSTVTSRIDGDATISGLDHAPDATLLADQTKAVAGLAMNTVPGRRKIALSGTSANIEGLPNPINNTAANIGAVLKSVRDYAKDYADLKLTGSRTLGTADNGSYGTPENPTLVYVRLEDNGTLTLHENYQGYGTLVVETEESEHSSVLHMRDFASWHGLVLIYLRGGAEIDGGTLVRARDDSKIIGGLAMYLNTRFTDIRGLGAFYDGSERAAVLHSSDLLSTARGTGTVLSAEVVCYRLP